MDVMVGTFLSLFPAALWAISFVSFLIIAAAPVVLLFSLAALLIYALAYPLRSTKFPYKTQFPGQAVTNMGNTDTPVRDLRKIEENLEEMREVS